VAYRYEFPSTHFVQNSIIAFTFNFESGKEEKQRSLAQAAAANAQSLVLSFTWKYIKFRSLLTSGANTSTVFSYISTRFGCSFDFGWGIAREQQRHVYSITA